MQDLLYKKSLLKNLNLPETEISRLDSIVGKNELLTFLKSARNSPQIYEGSENDHFNVRNGIFQANFHIHTDNSDGFMSVEELLDLAQRYSMIFAQKNPGQKVYIAITDHDNVGGDIKALNMITQNPDKYRNLKLVLGMEMSSSFHTDLVPYPINAHLLTYCINPFSSAPNRANEERLQTYINGAQKTFTEVFTQFQEAARKRNFQFELADMQAIRHQVYQFPHDIQNTFKDTIQFKYLFHCLVLDNPKAIDFLTRHHIDVLSLDFTRPKQMIQRGPKRPYWLNYVDETYNYLMNTLTQKGQKVNADKLKQTLDVLSENDISVLSKMETAIHNTFRPFFNEQCQPIDFDKAMTAFMQDKHTVCAIAHPAFTLSSCSEHPKRMEIIHEFISRFNAYLSNDPLIIEQFYPYEGVTPQWIKEVYSVAKEFPYIPSGSRDSHRNSFFTRAKVFTPQELNALVPHKITHQSTNVKVKQVERTRE